MLLPAPLHASAGAASGDLGELSPAASPNLLPERLITDLQECLGGEWQEPLQRFSRRCQLPCKIAQPHVCLFHLLLAGWEEPPLEQWGLNIVIAVK